MESRGRQQFRDGKTTGYPRISYALYKFKQFKKEKGQFRRKIYTYE